MRARGYRKVYIPYYTCDVILEPFMKLGIDYEFYHVDINLEIRDEFSFKSNEALLYVNYYGLKQRYVEYLAARMENKLIVDNTQAFYSMPIDGIDTFYTCRKFFGVPDGAYLYTDKLLNDSFEYDVSFDRMTSLTKRIDLGAEAGYSDFKSLSKALGNYIRMHNALCDSNILLLNLEDDAVPMVYPYMSSNEGLREILIEKKVFVARYWPNVTKWTSPNNLEYQLTMMMQPIPIDQRYGEKDVDYITHLVMNNN